MLEKIKFFWTPAIFILVAVLAFGLGRISRIEDHREPIVIESLPLVAAVATIAGEPSPSPPPPAAVVQTPPPASQGGYVASKSGAKYHLVTCGSAKSIKEENRIYFSTKQAAEAAGYEPAKNCKGI
jgi:hypothetical protein